MKLKFFKLCAKLARNSDHPKHQLGSVIVSKKGRILSLGINKYKTHPKSPHSYKYLHAEVSALINLDDNINLKDAVCYVFRETKDGLPAMSRCCDSCLKALKDAGIKTIHYSIENGYATEHI